MRSIKKVLARNLRIAGSKTPDSYIRQCRHFSSSSPGGQESSAGNQKNSNSNNSNNKTWSSQSLRGPVTYFTLGVTLLVAGGVAVFYDIEKERLAKSVVSKEVVTTGKPSLGGPWSLVDQDGRPCNSAQFYGRFTLIYFGFTHCPDICPSELVKIGKIIDELDRRNTPGVVTPIFISVDPSRDTVGQLKVYRQDFHPAMIYLTGASEQIARVTRLFRVYFSKANEIVDEQDEEEYLVDHSIVLYLMSPQGEFLDFYTQRTQVADVVAKIEQHIKTYKDQILVK